MPAREKLVMQWIPSCKFDMSKHASDDTNLVLQSDCILKFRNSLPPIPSDQVSFAPSASTADDPQPGKDEQREGISKFLASLPGFSTATTQWNHFTMAHHDVTHLGCKLGPEPAI
jgi:hypothetical protein